MEVTQGSEIPPDMASRLLFGFVFSYAVMAAMIVVGISFRLTGPCGCIGGRLAAGMIRHGHLCSEMNRLLGSEPTVRE